ncbi:MAG: hypothetical protein V5B35_14640 [Candidatus Accumulibacter necessarius]|jgi:hypothetical protein|uniref:hypothetical protein n=1 Tax=Candidatus Accumulibacter necessarius TaxID=2954386 RepID=UPI002FC27D29
MERKWATQTLFLRERLARGRGWETHKVRPMFEERILPVTEDIMFTWRLLVEEGRKTGHTFSQPDLIIAATALHHPRFLCWAFTGSGERHDWQRLSADFCDCATVPFGCPGDVLEIQSS